MTRLSLLAVAALAAGCSSTPVLQSAPAATPPTVDGSEADWAGVLRPVEGHAGVALGVRDAADALYVVAVLRGENQIRSALAGGLTLWLDPEGGTDRALGVRFPTGAGRATGSAPQRGVPEERFAEATRDLEVLRDGAEAGTRIPATSTTGLRAAATLDADVLVIEYRVPRRAVPNGIDPSGDAVGVGLTTPAVSRPDDAGRQRGDGGSRRGAGGSRGGTGGGGRPGRAARPERPEPLDVWVRVALATPPAGPSPGRP